MNATGPDVFAPAQLGPLRLRNRVIKAATFEGRTPHALVTDDLIDFHVRPARGGVGMTTVACCAAAAWPTGPGWPAISPVRCATRSAACSRLPPS